MKLFVTLLASLLSASAFSSDQNPAPQCVVTFRGEPPVAVTLEKDGKHGVARSSYWSDAPLERISATEFRHIRGLSGGKVEFTFKQTPDGRIPARYQWQQQNTSTIKTADGMTSVQMPSDFVSASGQFLADLDNEVGIGPDAADTFLRIKCERK